MNETSEVESVCRALASYHWRLSGNDPEKESAVIDRRWRNFTGEACAAIEAMRAHQKIVPALSSAPIGEK